MEGRFTVLLACVLLSGSTGCRLTKNGGQTVHMVNGPTPAASSVPAPIDATPPDDGKRSPRIAVALAAYKEAEARSLNQEPETQFKVRDEARKLYQEAIKQDPSFVDAHRGLVRVYVDLGDFPRAQETVKKAQTKFPRESIFWYEEAQMYNRKKEFAEAIKALNRALEMDPENRMYMTTLGFTLARAGMTDQAVTTLARSMGLASAHYNVARMLLHLQRGEQAVQHLHLAVRANPNLESARRLLEQIESGQRPQVTLDIDVGQ